MSKLNLQPNTVLVAPHITEKAALGADKSNVYVFKVTPDATKKSISASVKDAYGVVPTRIHMVAIPAKKVIVRGKRGVRSGGKKAYVYLKKGDKIELI